jgi:uncharacterized protein DUF4232
MRQRAWFLALGTLALVLAGCGGGAAGRGAGPPGAGAAPCRAAALVLGYGPQVSPQTEEHADWYTLTNHGPSACVLDGYPAVTLYRADGTRLRFRHADPRHSQYLTSAPPRMVLLRPGASAWVLVAKNACIGPGRWRVARIRIALPGQRHESVTGPVAAGHGGAAMLDHCRDPRDPGQAVAVSPVEPTRLATLPVV